MKERKLLKNRELLLEDPNTEALPSFPKYLIEMHLHR